MQPTPMRMGHSYILPAQPVQPVILPVKPAVKPVPKKPIGAQAQPQKPKAQPEKPKQAQPQKPKEIQGQPERPKQVQPQKPKEVPAQPKKPKAAKAKEAQAQPQKVLPADAVKRLAARRLGLQQAQPWAQAQVQIQRVQVQLQQAQIQVQLQQAQRQIAILSDIELSNFQGPDLSRIVLADGKPEPIPTCYAGAFRIRARTAAGKDKDSAGITFEVTAEPRHSGWNIIGKPRLERARDARGQLVTLILEQPPNQVATDLNQLGRLRMAQLEAIYITHGNGSTPLKRTVQIQIKLGEKPGKLLEDMTGQITVEAKTGPQDLIVVDNILTAKGKTTKGARGGSIEVTEVIKDKNGNHQISFKIDKGPADQGNVALVDAKGVSFPLFGRSVTNNNGAYVETLIFPVQKGREPAKLVFSAPLTVNVDVPFSFKGLKLP